jgi:predicted amidohydrolase
MADLTITLVQTRLFWENKRANLEMLQDKIMHIPQQTEVLILPEMFTTGFSMNPAALAETMDGEAVNWMKEISMRHSMVVTGSIIIAENGKYFNRLICMLPNGQYGYYDKRHLFAFGNEHQHYTRGEKRLIASVKGWRINLQVCYDLRFPVWARQQTTDDMPEYDLLVYVANWPARRSHAWKTLLCARAIENQCFVAGVNRVGKDGNDIDHSGDSMIIDPLGQVLYHQQDDEDIFTITLQRDTLEQVRAQFPFWKDGDEFRIES